MEEKQGNHPPTSSPGPAESKDLGFGTQLTDVGVRLLNHDGTANVTKMGRPWFRPYDLYLNLISMSWQRFAVVVFLFYVVLNLFFSLLYLAVGIEHLTGIEGETTWERFLEAFFFSSQTVTTLGYGRIAPVGTPASTVAAIESLVGLMGFALATGLLYGRFSRPQAKIRFSVNAVVAPYQGGHGLMVRLANERSSQLIEAEAVVTMSYFNAGSDKRMYHRLELEVDKITFLPLSWTLVHAIGPDSPLSDWTPEDYKARGLEVIVMLKAFDDSFGTTVYERRSYVAGEILWGRKFVRAIGHDGKRMTLDLAKMSETEAVELPAKAKFVNPKKGTKFGA